MSLHVLQLWRNTYQELHAASDLIVTWRVQSYVNFDIWNLRIRMYTDYIVYGSRSILIWRSRNPWDTVLMMIYLIVISIDKTKIMNLTCTLSSSWYLWMTGWSSIDRLHTRDTYINNFGNNHLRLEFGNGIIVWLDGWILNHPIVSPIPWPRIKWLM